MIQVSQGGKTVKSSGISSDGNRAVSCAGDVAQFVQAPVTGMLPFGGVEKKKTPNSRIVCPITSPRGPCMVD